MRRTIGHSPHPINSCPIGLYNNILLTGKKECLRIIAIPTKLDRRTILEH